MDPTDGGFYDFSLVVLVSAELAAIEQLPPDQRWSSSERLRSLLAVAQDSRASGWLGPLAMPELTLSPRIPASIADGEIRVVEVRYEYETDEGDLDYTVRDLGTLVAWLGAPST